MCAYITTSVWSCMCKVLCHVCVCWKWRKLHVQFSPNTWWSIIVSSDLFRAPIVLFSAFIWMRSSLHFLPLPSSMNSSTDLIVFKFLLTWLSRACIGSIHDGVSGCYSTKQTVESWIQHNLAQIITQHIYTWSKNKSTASIKCKHTVRLHRYGMTSHTHMHL